MKTAVEVMETVFKAHEELRRFRGDVMDFDFYDAAVDDAVEAERDRVMKLLYFWSQTERDCEVLRDAIRYGLTVEQLEAKLREGA